LLLIRAGVGGILHQHPGWVPAALALNRCARACRSALWSSKAYRASSPSSSIERAEDHALQAGLRRRSLHRLRGNACAYGGRSARPEEKGSPRGRVTRRGWPTPRVQV